MSITRPPKPPLIVSLPPPLAQPRFVYVLWNNEMYDGSEIFAVYTTEEAAKKAAHSLFYDVERVLFYEH